MKLRVRWFADTASLKASEEELDKGFQELLSAYSASGRFYHGKSHLDHLFGLLDRYRDALQDPLAVAFAIWYHDYVYSSIRGGNEQKSADFARKRLSAWGMDQSRTNRIVALILATETHQLPAPPSSLPESQHRAYRHDAALFLDFDMDVLSANQNIYEQYARDVRKEYRLIPRPIYRKGRLKVLQAFLDSERIYHSAPWRDREEAARRNIRWEIDTWTSRGKL